MHLHLPVLHGASVEDRQRTAGVSPNVVVEARLDVEVAVQHVRGGRCGGEGAGRKELGATREARCLQQARLRSPECLTSRTDVQAPVAVPISVRIRWVGTALGAGDFDPSDSNAVRVCTTLPASVASDTTHAENEAWVLPHTHAALTHGVDPVVGARHRHIAHPGVSHSVHKNSMQPLLLRTQAGATALC